MANNRKSSNNSVRQNINLTQGMNSLRRQMKGIYKDTYSTNPNVKDDIERLSNSIEDRINNVLIQ